MLRIRWSKSRNTPNLRKYFGFLILLSLNTHFFKLNGAWYILLLKYFWDPKQHRCFILHLEKYLTSNIDTKRNNFTKVV